MPGRNSDDSTLVPGQDGARLTLGGATVDLARQTVIRGGEEIRLRLRTADVLGYLVRHAGRVVSKQELIAAVWGDVAVTDDSLVQCLVEIRRALGPDQGQVRTVRGRGYLLDLMAPTASPPPAAQPDATPVPWRGSPVETPARVPGRTPRFALVAGGLLALGVTLVIAGRSSSPEAPVVAPSQTMNADARRALESAYERLSRSRSQVNIQQARVAFERAVELDRGYAPAQAGLANTLTLLSVFGVEAPNTVLPAASTAARRAVELDPTHSAAWLALAHTNVQWDRDWPEAERHYRRALALDPNADFNFLLAHLLVGLGRTAEAIVESDRVLAVDPSSPVRLGSNCVVNYLARRFENALDACNRAIAADAGHTLSQFWKALALVELARHDEAMAAALEAGRQMGNAPAWVVGFVHARAGRRSEASEVLAALEESATRGYAPPVDIALLRAAVGDRAAALDWLERGLGDHGRWMELLAVHPAADPLRQEPRFRALLRALRLPVVRRSPGAPRDGASSQPFPRAAS